MSNVPQCMTIMSIIITEEDIWKKLLKKCSTPQATDKFNPKVNPQTCGIIQMLYVTKQIETMTFGKSVIALFSKIEPKMSK